MIWRYLVAPYTAAAVAAALLPSPCCVAAQDFKQLKLNLECEASPSGVAGLSSGGSCMAAPRRAWPFCNRCRWLTALRIDAQSLVMKANGGLSLKTTGPLRGKDMTPTHAQVTS